MVRWWWLPGLVAVTGCAGSDADLLASLDGSWSGTLKDGQTIVPLAATFDWHTDEQVLFGSVTATLPGQDAPWTFAVRRSDTDSGNVYLELTDETDGTRGLELDGPVDDGAFTGDGTLSYDCPEGTCGYAGPFTLKPGPPASTTPTGTPPPTEGT